MCIQCCKLASISILSNDVNNCFPYPNVPGTGSTKEFLGSSQDFTGSLGKGCIQFQVTLVLV